MAKRHLKARVCKKNRTATIATAYYPYLKDLEHRGDRPIPAIRLQGLWLRQAGFEMRGRISIRISKRRLVITTE